MTLWIFKCSSSLVLDSVSGLCSQAFAYALDLVHMLLLLIILLSRFNKFIILIMIITLFLLFNYGSSWGVLDWILWLNLSLCLSDSIYPILSYLISLLAWIDVAWACYPCTILQYMLVLMMILSYGFFGCCDLVLQLLVQCIWLKCGTVAVSCHCGVDHEVVVYFHLLFSFA